MDGFSPNPQDYSGQTSESLVTTILQLRNQVKFMDQFLSLVYPEYSQVKSLVSKSQRYGMAPGFPVSPMFPENPVFMPTPNMTSYPPPPGHAHPPTTMEMGYSSKNVSGCDGGSVAAAGVKVRKRKSATTPKPSSPPSDVPPTGTGKRRGRKRKYPLPVPTSSNDVNVSVSSKDASGNVAVSSSEAKDVSINSGSEVESIPNPNVPVPNERNEISTTQAVPESFVNGTVETDEHPVPIPTTFTVISESGTEEHQISFNGEEQHVSFSGEEHHVSFSGEDHHVSINGEEHQGSFRKEEHHRVSGEDHQVPFSGSSPEGEPCDGESEKMTCLDMLAAAASIIRHRPNKEGAAEVTPETTVVPVPMPNSSPVAQFQYQHNHHCSPMIYHFDQGTSSGEHLASALYADSDGHVNVNCIGQFPVYDFKNQTQFASPEFYHHHPYTFQLQENHHHHQSSTPPSSLSGEEEHGQNYQVYSPNLSSSTTSLSPRTLQNECMQIEEVDIYDDGSMELQYQENGRQVELEGGRGSKQKRKRSKSFSPPSSIGQSTPISHSNSNQCQLQNGMYLINPLHEPEIVLQH